MVLLQQTATAAVQTQRSTLRSTPHKWNDSPQKAFFLKILSKLKKKNPLTSTSPLIYSEEHHQGNVPTMRIPRAWQRWVYVAPLALLFFYLWHTSPSSTPPGDTASLPAELEEEALEGQADVNTQSWKALYASNRKWLVMSENLAEKEAETFISANVRFSSYMGMIPPNAAKRLLQMHWFSKGGNKGRFGWVGFALAVRQCLRLILPTIHAVQQACTASA